MKLAIGFPESCRRVSLPALEAGREVAARDEDSFERFMKRLDAMQETPEERQRRIAAEKKAAQEKRIKTQKETELNSRIAHLRSRLMSFGPDDSTSAELSMAKTQLFWVSSSL